MKNIIFLLLLTGACAADTITLKNGDVYHNVQIIKTENDKVRLRATSGEFTVSVDRIHKIEQHPYAPNTPSQTIMGNTTHHRALNAHYTYPNTKLWPITALAAVVAVDAFAESGQLGNQHKAFKDLGADQSTLDNIKSAQTRKAIVGGVAVVAAVLNTIVLFERVEITGEFGQLGLAFKL